MWDSTPPRTPLEVTFEDSDSEPGTITPDYDAMSPVVAHLEKLAVTHEDEKIEDSTTSKYEPSLESNTSVGDDSPPESPIEAFLPRPDTPHQSHCPLNPEGKITVRNGQAYTSDEIKLMYLSVAEARHNGELPATTETSLDVHAVTDDFNSLVHLRRVRGNHLEHAPPSYVHLREQIALGIQQRAASQHRDNQQEAARRVNHYLQAVEHEQRYYNASNAMVRRPIEHGFINVDDDMCSMVEHTIEQGIADATGPLRMNVGRFSANVEQHTGLLKQQSNFIQAQEYAVEKQVLLAAKQKSLAERLSATLQQNAGILQHQGNLTQHHAGMLQHQSNIVQRQDSLTEHHAGILQRQDSLTQHHAGMLQHQSNIVQRQDSLTERHAGILQHQSHVVQQQDQALQKQYDLLQNQSFSLRKESRFFKKQNDALEKQNQAVREQLKIQHDHIARMQDLLEPQAYNNYATAQNLASANQLVSNLSYELPQVIKKAFEDSIEETARMHARQALESAVDIWQQGIPYGMSANESVSSSDTTVDAYDKPELNTQIWAAYKKPEKKKATTDAEFPERSERSSLYRMVSKFKRRRIAHN
ncbi:hypothetical protein NXS19_010098 [Fusarium pseudograminearum]|uniref:Uncharacterized protein n=1 Tax=Fusarium pseudograminearum (strain CS3096) TaxID=1028729 RepID=K3VSW4_FUSPC|nr:hypothetical protein FPSE_00960 [Fusarium pseudograminearum CS3096]EKJ78817.1 hypothetical protein FPSE_00960 [Fusarium pseudograminearum CS3096]KAF0636837.1 hypothetical protein FPSE5266_00960 [Fusarium pseudograminearum]UZP42282.1 hypothetical protein NXS19_010098 [Fusarium pseudograminearum]